MPPPSSAPVPLRAGLLALALSGSLISASAAPAEQRPSELICHTSNPDECYPRHFVARDTFQIVHDDQDLPPGLHVRINLQTGKKEAKINVPGEVDTALEGLPVDDASVVVVPGQDEDEKPIRPPKGAPAYNPIGKIKEPEKESESFKAAMKMLRDGRVHHGNAFAEHLEELEELSHDIYYGMKIAEDTPVVKALVCLMVSKPAKPPTVGTGLPPSDQHAASILGGALQNNPAALAKVAAAWPELMAAKCGDTTIGRVLYPSLRPSNNADDAKHSASRVKAKILVVNGLIRDDAIRRDFLKLGGMDRLLEVLLSEGDEWATTRRKAGQLVLDNFLDSDMGAKLGVWPRVPRLSDEQCRSAGVMMTEGCWDHHVARLAEKNDYERGHWSTDLNAKLVAARGGDPAALPDGPVRAEL